MDLQVGDHHVCLSPSLKSSLYLSKPNYAIFIHFRDVNKSAGQKPIQLTLVFSTCHSSTKPVFDRHVLKFEDRNLLCLLLFIPCPCVACRLVQTSCPRWLWVMTLCTLLRSAHFYGEKIGQWDLIFVWLTAFLWLDFPPFLLPFVINHEETVLATAGRLAKRSTMHLTKPTRFNDFKRRNERYTVGHKSHDPYFHVFLMEAGVMTFVAHCTVPWKNEK